MRYPCYQRLVVFSVSVVARVSNMPGTLQTQCNCVT
jgi:hypothetical protein